MLTDSERKLIIKLTVMMTNAAPGATYLADLVANYEGNGKSLEELAKSIAASPVYKNFNPDSQLAADFAVKLLEPFGLTEDHYLFAYVVGLFYGKADKGEVAVKVLSIIDAGRDPELMNVQAMIANKVDVAEYLSVTLNAPETDLSKLIGALGVITGESSSVAAAKAELDKTYGVSAATLELVLGALTSPLPADPAGARDAAPGQLTPQSFIWREANLAVGDSVNSAMGFKVALAGVVTADDGSHIDLSASLFN